MVRRKGYPMSDKPNFVLVPDPEPEAPAPAPEAPARVPATHAPASVLTRLRDLVAPLAAPFIALLPGAARDALPVTMPTRPRLVFGFDATASREPAWDTARKVTDSL